jgi:hypothetical protein
LWIVSNASYVGRTYSLSIHGSILSSKCGSEWLLLFCAILAEGLAGFAFLLAAGRVLGEFPTCFRSLRFGRSFTHDWPPFWYAKQLDHSLSLDEGSEVGLERGRIEPFGRVRSSDQRRAEWIHPKPRLPPWLYFCRSAILPIIASKSSTTPFLRLLNGVYSSLFSLFGGTVNGK